MSGFVYGLVYGILIIRMGPSNMPNVESFALMICGVIIGIILGLQK